MSARSATPALDALSTGAACVERRHAFRPTLGDALQTSWLDDRVAANMLRELDVLLIHALAEAAAAAGIAVPSRPNDVPATVAVLRAASGMPFGHSEALVAAAAWRRRLSRRAARLRRAGPSGSSAATDSERAARLAAIASTYRHIAEELRGVGDRHVLPMAA